MNCKATKTIGQTSRGFVMGECSTEMVEICPMPHMDKGYLDEKQRQVVIKAFLYQCPSCKSVVIE